MEKAGQLVKNRYELHNVLGKGANAVVYRATDTLTGQQVAIKRMFETAKTQKGSRANNNNKPADRDPATSSWLAEVHLLQSLEHPNIVRYLDDSDEGATISIVMEYATGGSLLDLIKRGPLVEAAAASYVGQVLSGLLYLHGRRVLHRDVKAANVLLFDRTPVGGGLSLLERRGSRNQLLVPGAAAAAAEGTAAVDGSTSGSPSAKPPATAAAAGTAFDPNSTATAAGGALSSSTTSSASPLPLGRLSIHRNSDSSDPLPHSLSLSQSQNHPNTADLLPETLQAKLSDFGLAVPRPSTGDKNEQFTVLVGSVYWMAPESIASGQYSEESDIWSLGCLAFELLTGAPPFFDRAPVNALYHIAKTTEDVPLPANVSEECRAFLSTCLRLRPGERPKASVLRTHPWVAPFMTTVTTATTAAGSAPLNSPSLALPVGGTITTTAAGGGGGVGDGPFFGNNNSITFPQGLDLGGSMLMQQRDNGGQAAWVENGLFGEAKLRWLDNGGLPLAVHSLTSITAEESFRVVRSISYAAQRCRQTISDREQHTRHRQQAAAAAAAAALDESMSHGSATLADRQSSAVDLDALFAQSTNLNRPLPTGSADAHNVDAEEFEFAVKYFKALGDLNFWELDLSVLAATDSLASLYCDCCHCQQPDALYYTPTHPRALHLLLGPPHAAATRCAAALHKLLAVDEERHIMDSAHAEAARKRARADGTVEHLRDILDEHCRAAFRERAASSGISSSDVPTSTSASPNGGGGGGGGGGGLPSAAAGRRSTIQDQSASLHHLHHHGASAAASGASVDGVRWAAVDHLFGVIRRLCDTPNEVLELVRSSEEAWILSLQEAAAHQCTNAVLLLLDTLRVAVPVLSDRSTRVASTALIGLATDQLLPVDLRVAIAQALPSLQKQSPVVAAVLRDPAANIPLLALLFRLSPLRWAPPTTATTAVSVSRNSTSVVVPSLQSAAVTTAAAPSYGVAAETQQQGARRTTNHTNTPLEPQQPSQLSPPSHSNAINTAGTTTTTTSGAAGAVAGASFSSPADPMVVVFLELCEDDAMAASCASYDGFIPLIVQKIAEGRARGSNAAVANALRFGELLFAASPRPELFVTSKAVTKALVEILRNARAAREADETAAAAATDQHQNASSSIGAIGLGDAASTTTPPGEAQSRNHPHQQELDGRQLPQQATGVVPTSSAVGANTSAATQQQQELRFSRDAFIDSYAPPRPTPQQQQQSSYRPGVAAKSGLSAASQAAAFQPSEEVERLASRFLDSLAAQAKVI